MAQVSAQYIEGIKEGRQHFKLLQECGEVTRDTLLKVIRECEAFGKRLAGCAYSEGSADYIKGELDFYRAQLKRLP